MNKRNKLPNQTVFITRIIIINEVRTGVVRLTTIWQLTQFAGKLNHWIEFEIWIVLQFTNNNGFLSFVLSNAVFDSVCCIDDKIQYYWTLLSRKNKNRGISKIKYVIVHENLYQRWFVQYITQFSYQKIFYLIMSTFRTTTQ